MKTTKQQDTTSHRFDRGGSWVSDEPSWVRAASRYANEPADRGSSIGFRCALRGREPRV